MTAWALTLIANILEFAGTKIAANKAREAAIKRKKAAIKKKKARAKKKRLAEIARLEAKRLEEAQIEYERQEKSKRVQADLKARIAALQVPGDYVDDY